MKHHPNKRTRTLTWPRKRCLKPSNAKMWVGDPQHDGSSSSLPSKQRGFSQTKHISSRAFRYALLQASRPLPEYLGHHSRWCCRCRLQSAKFSTTITVGSVYSLEKNGNPRLVSSGTLCTLVSCCYNQLFGILLGNSQLWTCLGGCPEPSQVGFPSRVNTYLCLVKRTG